MSGTAPARPLLHLFGSSIIDQAMLSAANFAVGLLLIRYTPEAQYGYYVLAFNAMILATTLQGTFLGTPLIIRMATLPAGERPGWIGSLLRDQLRWVPAGAALVLTAAGVAWLAGWLSAAATEVVAAGLVLAACALYREYFRGVLLMYQRPLPVLRADLFYVGSLVAGATLASTLENHAAVAALMLAAGAAWCSSLLLRDRLHDEIDPKAPAGRWRELAAMGVWSAAGAVVYWLFTQGYSFLAAATLDVRSVAALAASRLLLMPINLLVAGVQKQLTPVASGWLQADGASPTLRRLAGFSLALGFVTLAYAGVVWLLRDWIFQDLMRKSFDDRDALVLLWSVIMLAMVLRDPLTQLLVLRSRFRLLTGVASACAVLALGTSYLGMLRFGTRGALFGILAGELANLIATVVLALREARHAQAA